MTIGIWPWIKYCSSSNFWMCCICACSTTSTHQDGPSKKVRHICWVWFTLNNSLPWTIDGRFIHCKICRLSIWWNKFSAIRGEKKKLKSEIAWKVSSLSHFDPRSPVCEQEVQKIIHLQNIANQMPDAFTDSKRITKSHIPAVNVSIRIDVPKGPSTSVILLNNK